MEEHPRHISHSPDHGANINALLLIIILYLCGYIYFHLYFKYKNRELTEHILPISNDTLHTRENIRVIKTQPIIYKDNYMNHCTICLESFNDDELVEQLICNHYYHKTCIQVWFKKNSTCPLCRMPMELLPCNTT